MADLPEIRNINLIPFGEMQIVNGKPNFGEVWQNCLIFLPFGLYLGLLNFGKSKKLQILIIAGVSLLLEIMQYVLAVGASDITDLLANTAGGILGILLYNVFSRLFKSKTQTVLNIVALICTIGFMALFVLIFAVNA